MGGEWRRMEASPYPPSRRIPGGMISIESQDRGFPRNVVVVTLGSLVGSGAAFLTTLLLAHAFDAYAFGVFAVAYSIYGLAAIASRLGLVDGVSRYVAFFLGRGDAAAAKSSAVGAISIGFTAGIVTCIGLVVVSTIAAAELFPDKEVATVLRLFALGVPPFAALYIGTACLRGIGQVHYHAIVVAVYPSLVLLTLSVMKVAEILSLTVVPLVWVVASMTCFLWLVNRFLSRFRPLPGTARLWRLPPGVTTFSLVLAVNGLVSYLLIQTGLIMVAYLLGVEQAGLYRGAMQAALAVQMIGGGLQLVYAPRMAYFLGRADMLEVRQTYVQVISWGVMIGAPLALVAVFFPREILAVILPDRFAAVSAVFLVLVLTETLTLMLGPSAVLLLVARRHGLVLGLTAASLVCQISLGVLLIGRFGVSGAAFAALASNVLLVGIATAIVFRTFDTLPLNRTQLRVVVPIIPILAVFLLKDEWYSNVSQGWIGSLSLVTIGLALYAATLAGTRLAGLLSNDPDR